MSRLVEYVLILSLATAAAGAANYNFGAGQSTQYDARFNPMPVPMPVARPQAKPRVSVSPRQPAAKPIVIVRHPSVPAQPVKKQSKQSEVFDDFPFTPTTPPVATPAVTPKVEAPFFTRMAITMMQIIGVAGVLFALTHFRTLIWSRVQGLWARIRTRKETA